MVLALHKANLFNEFYKKQSLIFLEFREDMLYHSFPSVAIKEQKVTGKTQKEKWGRFNSPSIASAAM